MDRAVTVTTTRRQAPVAASIGVLLEDLLSKAAALDDNAWEDGCPVDHALINQWDRQVNQIRRFLESAGKARPIAQD